MRCHTVVVASLLLAGCGDRTVGPETCGDMGTRYPLSAEMHAECKNNVGCTQMTPQCGCHCRTCENEVCVSGVCDDSCMPVCPTVRPVSGTSCTATYLPASCVYVVETCPCGPNDVTSTCTCTNGSWSCARGYDCYPCMDGRKDGGVDARRDGAQDIAIKKKDQQPQLDQQPKLDAPCTIPSYPSDCAGVSYFDCGFSATCSGNVVKASWHEHVFCGSTPPEQIISYTCSTTCPNGCNASATGWPQSGADLVKQYCNP
jgi:hypothetical protein